jgi:cytochrome c oxidase subunit IV
MAEHVDEREAEAAPHDAPHAAPHQGGHRGHPSAREYVRIGVVLAVLTAIEVWLSYSGLPDGLMIALLFVAAILKFVLVAMWFMHLKFDDPRYSRFFVIGIAGAVTLYLIVLLTFRVFLR